MTKLIKPPFGALWGIVNYLDHDECRDYCDMISNGYGDHHHIYCDVLHILRWMSKCPDASPEDAQECLDRANTEIREARAEAKAKVAARD
jgi:hypothetical protein